MQFSPFKQNLKKMREDWDDTDINEYNEDEGRGLYELPGFIIRAKFKNQDVKKFKEAEGEWEKLKALGIKFPEYQLVVGNRKSEADYWIYVVVKRIDGQSLPNIDTHIPELDQFTLYYSILTICKCLQYLLSKFDDLNSALYDLRPEQFQVYAEEVYLVDLDPAVQNGPDRDDILGFIIEDLYRISDISKINVFSSEVVSLIQDIFRKIKSSLERNKDSLEPMLVQQAYRIMSEISDTLK